MVERRYLVIAALLHVLLFALLFVSAFFTRDIVAPTVFEAVLIEDPTAARQRAQEKQRELERQQQREEQEQKARAEQQKLQEQKKLEQQKKEQQKKEQQKKAEQEKESEEARAKLQEEQRRKREELELKAEAERQRQEEARKKVEEEKRRQDDLKRKAEEDEKRIAEERQRQLEEEQKEIERRQQEAERARQEAERIRKEKELAEKRAREKALSDALQAENDERIRGMQAQWGDLIAARIRKFWTRPPGTPPRFSTVVEVQIIPGGEVTSAKVVRSSGNVAVDRSVENAVLRASPLPPPPDPAAFQRVLRITFCPTPETCQ